MFDKKWVSITNSILALFTLMLYLSMHTIICYIGFYTFKALPYIIMAILIALAILSLLDTLYKHNKTMTIVLTILNILFFLAVLAYFIVNYIQLLVFCREMPKILGIYLLIYIVVYLIFYFPKSAYKTKIVSIVLCVVLSLAILIGFSDLKNFLINTFTEGPVVYAVEDEYQIVFTTRVKGTAFVKVGNQTFYDEKAGALIDNQTVHKISVPQELLDTEKSYTIGSKAIFLEETFSAIRGRTITKEYSFRPIDETDGLQYYTVADAHDNFPGVINAANYYGDDTDFVVVAGDSVNFFESKDSLERVLHLNYEISKGQIPVVFARGNHELKGEYASELYRYVGTNENDEFYFTFTLGESVWGVVLDIGESYDDDWYEFYGTANYDDYREKQLEFVQDLIDNSDNTYNKDGIVHRIAISHIPTAITSFDKLIHYEYLIDLNSKLNDIPLDIMLNGHIHQAYMVPKGYLVGDKLSFVNTTYTANKTNITPLIATGANYNSLLCSRHSNEQTLENNENFINGEFLGVALNYSLEENVLEVRFTNSKNEIVKTENPFAEDKSYGKVIYLSD